VGILQRQVSEFIKLYGDALPHRTLDWIHRHFHSDASGATLRWRVVFSTRRWRQALVGDVALRVLLVARKLRLWPLPGRRL
jgi:hypothetical protein